MGNTILIAEDFKPTLDFLEKLLREEGYTVFSTKSGQEAIKLASRHLPDCFLLDYKLEDGPVMPVCSFIRGHEALRDAPIIIYSGYTDEAVNCYENCQADSFINKASRYEEVLAAVRGQLKRRSRKKAAREYCDLVPDPATLRVLKYGKPAASLSVEQYRLFSALYQKRPEFCPAEELASFVFSDLHNDRTDALYSLAHRLREKLGVRNGRRIVCKKGAGWAYIQPRLREITGVQK